jgi:hypothetical protein
MTPPSAAKASILRSSVRLSVFTRAKVKNEVDHTALHEGVVSDRSLNCHPGASFLQGIGRGKFRKAVS